MVEVQNSWWSDLTPRERLRVNADQDTITLSKEISRIMIQSNAIILAYKDYRENKHRKQNVRTENKV